MAPADSEDEDEVAPAAAKKEPNDWILFTKRVGILLNDKSLKLPAGEEKQFCSVLKDQLLEQLKKINPEKKKLGADDYASISAETIMTARGSWVKPEASKQFLAGKNKNKDKPSSSSSSSDSEATAKKRGRPSKKNAVVDSEVA